VSCLSDPCNVDHGCHASIFALFAYVAERVSMLRHEPLVLVIYECGRFPWVVTEDSERDSELVAQRGLEFLHKMHATLRGLAAAAAARGRHGR
jgi:hypothetical protein